ncbi:glycoside hydrolase family 32 protein [Pedococcus aerophilus]|uniref:beta-fructofuranosidase n=1 Tax=Pedococcus aerophilus TaxID=436356 RepID=A0ABN3UL24_9MICO
MSTPDPRPSLVDLAEQDRHRPRFHFVSPAGWLNDPNGLTQWDGTYHLFYQYNPTSALHSRIHWGHATSADLVTWTDQPIALVPGDDGPDRDGCWSGVLVDDGGTPTVIYSGRHDERELACVATGSADLNTWVKDPANPVIAEYPQGLELTAYRDHCVWREDGRWRHLVGSGLVGEGGTALLYESTDLRTWDYVGPLITGDATTGTVEAGDWTGTMWECVDLFRPPLADATGAADGSDPVDVLVFSAWDSGVTHYPLYWTGRYAGDAFDPHELHRLDYGGRYFYAPQSFRDEGGRRLVFGWLQEGRTDEAMEAAGWSGVMSLPRVLTLGADGALLQAPAPEVAALRQDATTYAAQGLSSHPLDLGSGEQRDLELSVVLEPGAAVALTLAASPDGEEATVVSISRGTADPGRATVLLDRSRSSTDEKVDLGPRSGPVPVGEDGRVELRVLLDHSALEVFANGRALTARIYPTRADAVHVSVALVDGVAGLEAATTWSMRDVWDGPRPLYP